MANFGELLSNIVPFLGAGAEGFVQGQQAGQEYRRIEDLMNLQRQEAAERAQLNALARRREEQYLSRPSPGFARAYAEEYGVPEDEAAALPIGVLEPRLPGVGARAARRELEELKALARGRSAQIRANIELIKADAQLRLQELMRNASIRAGLESARARIMADPFTRSEEKQAALYGIEEQLAELSIADRLLQAGAGKARDRLSSGADKQAGTPSPAPTQIQTRPPAEADAGD